MNENLNLVEILEGCPKGTKFYSSVFGEVRFEGIDTSDGYPIKLQAYNKYTRSLDCCYYTKEGSPICAYDGECTLFPSKDQRVWSKFERFWDKPKVERFDPKAFQPFDKILVRDSLDERWSIDFFSHKTGNIVRALYSNWMYAIPFNEETKHLIGTTDDCPEYYKWWEE